MGRKGPIILYQTTEPAGYKSH